MVSINRYNQAEIFLTTEHGDSLENLPETKL